MTDLITPEFIPGKKGDQIKRKSAVGTTDPGGDKTLNQI